MVCLLEQLRGRAVSGEDQPKRKSFDPKSYRSGVVQIQQAVLRHAAAGTKAIDASMPLSPD
jgi:hypothetical protein